MATKMTINGVSTCQSAGTENYEKFQTGIGRRKRTLDVYKRQTMFNVPATPGARGHVQIEFMIDDVINALKKKK